MTSKQDIHEKPPFSDMTKNKSVPVAGYRKSALVGLLFLLSATGLAQVAITRLGIKAGVNRMTVPFDPELPGQSKPVPGYEAGLVFQHLGEPHLGIQLELGGRQLNWQHNQDSVRSFTLQQYDIEFTAATYVYFGKPQNSLLVSLGPAIGNTVRAKDQASGGEAPDTHLLGNPSRNYLFYGIAAGAGFTKKIGPTLWQLEGRFTQRLTNLYKIGPGTDLNFSRILPSTFSISLTYFVYTGSR